MGSWCWPQKAGLEAKVCREGRWPAGLHFMPALPERPWAWLLTQAHFKALPYQSDMHMYCSRNESSWLVLGLHQSSLGAPQAFIDIGKSGLKTAPSTAYEEQLPIAAVLQRAEMFWCAQVCQRHWPTIKDGMGKDTNSKISP